jgi:hypothetical protein
MADKLPFNGPVELNGNTNIKGAAVAKTLALAVNQLTPTIQATGGTTAGTVNQLTIKNFTGGAEEIHTLPAATAGARYAVQLSTVVAGGTDALIFDCAGSDAFETDAIAESRSGNLVVYVSPTAGQTRLSYTPTNDAHNFAEQGSIFWFWCVNDGLWYVQLDAKPNPAGTGLTGACAFAN